MQTTVHSHYTYMIYNIVHPIWRLGDSNILQDSENYRTTSQCNQCYQNSSSHFFLGGGSRKDFELILSIWASFMDYVGKGEINEEEE